MLTDYIGYFSSYFLIFFSSSDSITDFKESITNNKSYKKIIILKFNNKRIDDDEFRFNDASTHEGHLRQNGELTWIKELARTMFSEKTDVPSINFSKDIMQTRKYHIIFSFSTSVTLKISHGHQSLTISLLPYVPIIYP